MRVFFRVFLLGFLVVSLSGASAGQRPAPASLASAQVAPTLALIGPSTPQPPTGVIDIQVSIAGAVNLAAFEFDLEYDRSLIQVTGIIPQPFLGATASCNPSAARCAVALGPLDRNNTTSVGAYSYGTGSGATGAGVVAILRLQPTGASGTVSLRLSNALIADVAAMPVTPATQDATIVLMAPTPTATPRPTIIPTPTRTPTATPIAQFKRIYLPVVRRN
jgi:hypothetical protein